MATAVSRALATDPLRSFKFQVIINSPAGLLGGGGAGAGGQARFGFMSMSGLGISIEPVTYREGGDNITTRKMPGQADFNAVTLSRGLFPTDSENWQWMQMLFSVLYGGLVGGGGQVAGDFRTTVYVNILQHPAPGPIAPTQVAFKLYSAWIGSLAYSDLDAGGNAVSIEQMTLNYEGFDMQWAGTSGSTTGGSSW